MTLPRSDGHGLLELMVDRFNIYSTRRLEQRLEEPQFQGAVLHFDQPWEGALSGYCTVLHDQLLGNYKLYYRGLSDGRFECRDGEVTCLAISSDGIHWERPELGLHKWRERSQTNILLANQVPGSHNFTPFIDVRPGTSKDERFKALAGVAPTGLHAYVSADGIHWRRRFSEPVISEGMFDSQNVAFWSEHEQVYVCYMRTWTGDGFSGIRTISRSTSKDFFRWSRPRAMSFGRRPLEHLYTNQTQPYPGASQIYIGIAARFLPDRQVLSASKAEELQVDPNYYQDCSDVILLTSRGGYRYDRFFPGAFLRPGIGLEHWVSRTNFPALGLVRTGPTELSFYLNTHYAQPSAQICRYTLPLDRLGYLEARQKWGDMITKPLCIRSGDSLAINMSTSAAGAVQVALLDINFAPVSGFGWQESGLLIGNDISRSVTWSVSQKVRQLGDCGLEKVRLAIQLYDARLYAFRIQHASDQ